MDVPLVEDSDTLLLASQVCPVTEEKNLLLRMHINNETLIWFFVELARFIFLVIWYMYMIRGRKAHTVNICFIMTWIIQLNHINMFNTFSYIIHAHTYKRLSDGKDQ